jgi:hypothetical protein
MSYPKIYRLKDAAEFNIPSDATNGTNGWTSIKGWKLLDEIDLGADTFTFNSVEYSKIYAASVGYLSFESLVGDNNGRPLHSEAVAYFQSKKMIAAIWDDMNTGSTPPADAINFSTMYYLDTASKTFTIIWNGFQWKTNASTAHIAAYPRQCTLTLYLKGHAQEGDVKMSYGAVSSEYDDGSNSAGLIGLSYGSDDVAELEAVAFQTVDTTRGSGGLTATKEPHKHYTTTDGLKDSGIDDLTNQSIYFSFNGHDPHKLQSIDIASSSVVAKKLSLTVAIDSELDQVPLGWNVVITYDSETITSGFTTDINSYETFLPEWDKTYVITVNALEGDHLLEIPGVSDTVTYSTSADPSLSISSAVMDGYTVGTLTITMDTSVIDTWQWAVALKGVVPTEFNDVATGVTSELGSDLNLRYGETYTITVNGLDSLDAVLLTDTQDITIVTPTSLERLTAYDVSANNITALKAIAIDHHNPVLTLPANMFASFDPDDAGDRVKIHHIQNAIAKLIFSDGSTDASHDNSSESEFWVTSASFGTDSITTKTYTKIFKAGTKAAPNTITTSGSIDDDHVIHIFLDNGEASIIKTLSGTEEFKIENDMDLYTIYAAGLNVRNIVSATYTSVNPVLSVGDKITVEDLDLVIGSVTIDESVSASGAAASVSTNSYGGAGTVCFGPGTPVLTDQGEIAIEEITEENTINNEPVVDIVRQRLKANEIVLMKKDCFESNCPSQDTLITNDHLVYIPYRKRWYSAKRLVNGNNIINIKPPCLHVYNVLMESHSQMKVNNMTVETLHPNYKTEGVVRLFKH